MMMDDDVMDGRKGWVRKLGDSLFSFRLTPPPFIFFDRLLRGTSTHGNSSPTPDRRTATIKTRHL
jgi:hypothetical protein